MEQKRNLAEKLRALLGEHDAVRITSGSYMPCVWRQLAKTLMGVLVALMHWGIQEGDLMRDPEIVYVFAVQGGESTAEPIAFRNDYIGVHQEVYSYDESGHRTQERPELKKYSINFSPTCFKNLHEQGFFDDTATREIMQG